MGEIRTADQEREAGTRTIEEATRIASKHGKVVAVKQFSAHLDDDYLYVVLVEVTKVVKPWSTEYVTWLVNTSCSGCIEGRYFGPNEQGQAIDDFTERGRL